MILGDKLHTKNNENTCFILVLRVNINFQHKKNFQKNYQSQGHYILIMSPRTSSCDVLIFYVSFSLLLFVHTFLSVRFLGDAMEMAKMLTKLRTQKWS